MKIIKELNDIALPISEPEYRARPELSYSILSRYLSVGYDGLDHLFDKLESPSLTFGSCVDTALTDGKEAFDNRFYVADYTIGDKEKQIVDKLFPIYEKEYASFSLIPDDIVLKTADEFAFQKNWRDDTRVRVLKQRCVNYYNVKYYAKDKTVIDTDTYNDTVACVRALRTSPATQGLFADNDPMSPVRRYYQLKFAAKLKGVGYRIMMDLVIADYEDKVIYPYDLKTCGIPEWNFESNFMRFHYWIQANLYTAVLRANLHADDYFKDFRVEPFRFIVVNRKTLTPLVWEYPFSTERGSMVDNYGNEIKDPLDIGIELRHYLDLKPRVPDGISIDSPNKISCINLKTNSASQAEPSSQV